MPRERVDPAEPAAPGAEALGISVYAKQLVDGRDRRQLERLCCYITRPPLALERLSRRADGRLELDPHRPSPADSRPGQRPVTSKPCPCTHPTPAPPASGRSRWAWLIGHVFLADVEHCTHCGGPMRWLEAATSAEAIARLLAKHGLAPRPPPPSRSAPIAVGQLSFAFARSAR